MIEHLLDEILAQARSRFVILDEIEALGQPAIQPLFDALAQARYEPLHYTIVALLGNIGHPQAVDGLLELLHHEDPYLATRAIIALGNIADARAVSPLLELLANDMGDRTAIVNALGAIGDPRAIDPLIDIMRRVHLAVLGSPPRALAKIGHAAVAPLIDVLSQDTNLNVRVGALSALREIADPASLDVLLQAAINEEADIRWGAVVALGDIQDERSVNALINVLKNESAIQVRRYATSSLGRLKDSRALPVLIEIIHSDDSEAVRWMAADALGSLGGEQAQGVLLSLLDDADLYLQIRVIDALANFDDPQVTRALIEKLSDDRQPNQRRLRVCDHAAKALEHIGSSAAMDALDNWQQKGD
jgi:HEAT repeat protein